MRQVLAAFALLAAATTQAQLLVLPDSPSAWAVARVDHYTHVVELREPPEYTGTGLNWNLAGSLFGFDGDLEGGLVLVGAPASWSDGIAFLYDANTGETLRWLEAGENLYYGTSRPGFGTDVDLFGGYAAVVAPGAGSEFGFAPKGMVVFYDAARGVKLGSVWGNLENFVLSGVELTTGSALLIYASRGDSSTQVVSYPLPPLIPEPGAMTLALLGVAAGCCRRQGQIHSRQTDASAEPDSGTTLIGVVRCVRVYRSGLSGFCPGSC